MSKSMISRSKRGALTRKDSYDDGQTSPAIASSSGSDTDSASVSSLSSEDSVTKMMAGTQLVDSDDEYETGNNNLRCEMPYDYRKNYSMPWKTQLHVSNSGRLREKKKSRSPRHSAVLDNEIFTPLEQDASNKDHRSVRFRVPTQ